MFLIILHMILLYFVIICGSIFFSDVFNKKIEKTIIITFLSIVFLMYICSIINILLPSVYIISIISIALGIYTIIKKIKNNKLWEFLKENIFTYGLLYFTFIYCFLIVISYNKVLTDWDNYSYWSYYSKYVFYNNTLTIPSDYGINVYPPFPTIWEYFVMRFFGEYRQGIEVFAVQLISYSFFIPIFDKIKTIVGKVATSITIFVFPIVLLSLIFFESAYPDAFIGILAGYIFYCYITEKDNKFLIFKQALLIFILCITKPIGIYYAIIVIICLILYEIIQKIREKSIKIFLKSKELKVIYLLIAIVIIAFISLKAYTRIEQVYTVENENILNPKYSTTQTQYIINCFKAVFTGEGQDNEIAGAVSIVSMPEIIFKLAVIFSPFRISAFVFLLIIGGFGILIYYISKIKDKKFLKMLFCLFIGFIIYVFVLQLAYLTEFSVEEMLNHSGVDRYLTTFILTIFFFVYMMSMEMFSKTEFKKIQSKKTKEIVNNIFYILVAILLISMIPVNYLNQLTVNYQNENIEKQNLLDTAKPIVQAISSEKIPENSRVLVISQTEDSQLQNLIARYYLFPMKVKFSNNYTEDDDLSSFGKELNNYNYLYLYRTNDYFNENTKDIFENESTPKDETLYKINDSKKLEEVFN